MSGEDDASPDKLRWLIWRLTKKKQSFIIMLALDENVE